MKSELEFRVEWGDTDAAGIVYYPNYFKWFDKGTWHLLIRAGLDLEALRSDFGLVGCPRVAVDATFRHPARFFDLIRMTSHVESWTSKTFRVVHQLRIGTVLCAEGAEVCVCARNAPARQSGFEAVSIPPEFKQKLDASEEYAVR